MNMTTQGDAMEACQAHNLKVAGSIPAPATNPLTESIREPHPSKTELSAGSSAQDSQHFIYREASYYTSSRRQRWSGISKKEFEKDVK